MKSRIRTSPRIIPGLLVLVLLAIPLTAQATSMKAQNVVDLVDLSERIIVGDVINLTDGFDAQGVPYTEVTLRVTDSIRGANGSSYTFRQFGLMEPRQMPDGTTALSVSPDGWPRFVQNEEVMVFLYQASPQNGLRTTVGLLQGKFSKVGDEFVNDVGNHNVFFNVNIDAGQLNPDDRKLMNNPETMKADAFVSMVRRAVDQRWVETGVMAHAE